MRIRIFWRVPTANGVWGLVCYERNEHGEYLLLATTGDLPTLVPYKQDETA